MKGSYVTPGFKVISFQMQDVVTASQSIDFNVSWIGFGGEEE